MNADWPAGSGSVVVDLSYKIKFILITLIDSYL
jgi:hypothetical protein